MAIDQSRRAKVALSGIPHNTTALEGIVDYLESRNA
jgi:hypothetical protein